MGTGMTTGRAALVMALLASPLGAAVTPFDFTGHWSGHVVQQGRTTPLEADLTGTGTFTGTLGTDIGGFITCSLHGTQKRKVAITATCSNGSTAKIKGKLAAATHTVTGRYHSRRNGRGLSGKFTLTSPGACVPAGGDCTDPGTGGGESSVCCNGDCTAGTAGTIETHGCN
jgi:hypothetical protein